MQDSNQVNCRMIVSLIKKNAAPDGRLQCLLPLPALQSCYLSRPSQYRASTPLNLSNDELLQPVDGIHAASALAALATE
jgi:hypothetical protein